MGMSKGSRYMGDVLLESGRSTDTVIARKGASIWRAGSEIVMDTDQWTLRAKGPFSVLIGRGTLEMLPAYLVHPARLVDESCA